MKFVRDNFLSILVLPLLVLLIAGSFYRFVILRDYMVSYEIECDPSLNSCFKACADDSCSSEYYFAIIEKYANNLYKQCGPDVTDCEDSTTCTPEDEDKCTITFCTEEDGICSIETNVTDMQEPIDSEVNFIENSLIE